MVVGTLRCKVFIGWMDTLGIKVNVGMVQNQSCMEQLGYSGKS